MFLTPSDIYAKTNGGLDVILAQYPQAAESVDNPTKKFRVRAGDKTQSASLKQVGGGVWVVTDFGGDQKPRNCIEVVRLENNNCSFKEAIDIIATRFNLTPPEFTPQIFKADRTKTPATIEQEEGKYGFEIKDELTEAELKVLAAEKVVEYYLSTHGENWAKELNKVAARLNFFSLKNYWYVKNREVRTASSTDQYPIFMIQGKGFEKIYEPLADKKFRFRYFGTRPKDYLFGYERLIKLWEDLNKTNEPDPDKDDDDDDETKVQLLENAMICSGERDSFNASALGYNVLWQNSESAKLQWDTFLSIKGKCSSVYNVADIDTTGLRTAHELAMQYLEIKTVWLPMELREHKDWRGNPCKDLRDYLRFHTKKQFDALVKSAQPYQPWTVRKNYNKKGEFIGFKFEVDNLRTYNFLNRNGFYQFRTEAEKEGYQFIHIQHNCVKRIRPYEVKRFMNDFLEERHADNELRNAFYRTSQLNETSLANLKETVVDFTDYTKDSQYFFFSNKTWKATKDGIEEFRPVDVQKFVWDDELIKHRVELLSPPIEVTVKTAPDGTRIFDLKILRMDCLFLKYCINASRIHWRYELEDYWIGKDPAEKAKYLTENQFNLWGPLLTKDQQYEQVLHFLNKWYSFGYLAHGYKDPSRPWCVFAMDAKISDDGESHGGSGKSIAYKSLRLFKISRTLDGRNPKLTDNPHVYEGITEHTDYLFIDDANRYLKFDVFFSPLTGDLNVNPKNTKQYTIPFKDVPKFCITSNYTLSQVDPSTERRLLYTVFSDYYHYNKMGEYSESRSVKDDFGKNLFDDFTPEEWNQFFNSIAYATSFYLNYEKIDPPMDNVMMRNLQTEMGHAFQNWADIYFSPNSGRLDSLVHKIEAFENYKKESGQIKTTSQRFGKSLKAWCRYNKYAYNPKELQNTQGRITRMMFQKNKDGTDNVIAKKVSTEMIYIQKEKDINPAALEEAKPITNVVGEQQQAIHTGGDDNKDLPF